MPGELLLSDQFVEDYDLLQRKLESLQREYDQLLSDSNEQPHLSAEVQAKLDALTQEVGIANRELESANNLLKASRDLEATLTAAAIASKAEFLAELGRMKRDNEELQAIIDRVPSDSDNPIALNELTQENEQLKSKLGTLNDELTSLRGQVDGLPPNLDEIVTKYPRMAAETRTLQAENERLQDDNLDLLQKLYRQEP